MAGGDEPVTRYDFETWKKDVFVPFQAAVQGAIEAMRATIGEVSTAVNRIESKVDTQAAVTEAVKRTAERTMEAAEKAAEKANANRATRWALYIGAFSSFVVLLTHFLPPLPW